MKVLAGPRSRVRDDAGMFVTNSPAHQARVLIVEDERALAGVVSSYLSRAGYGTSVVHTGPEAVEADATAAPNTRGRAKSSPIRTSASACLRAWYSPMTRPN